MINDVQFRAHVYTCPACLRATTPFDCCPDGQAIVFGPPQLRQRAMRSHLIAQAVLTMILIAAVAAALLVLL